MDMSGQVVKKSVSRAQRTEPSRNGLSPKSAHPNITNFPRQKAWKVYPLIPSFDSYFLTTCSGLCRHSRSKRRYSTFLKKLLISLGEENTECHQWTWQGHRDEFQTEFRVHTAGCKRGVKLPWHTEKGGRMEGNVSLTPRKGFLLPWYTPPPPCLQGCSRLLPAEPVAYNYWSQDEHMAALFSRDVRECHWHCMGLDDSTTVLVLVSCWSDYPQATCPKGLPLQTHRPESPFFVKSSSIAGAFSIQFTVHATRLRHSLFLYHLLHLADHFKGFIYLNKGWAESATRNSHGSGGGGLGCWKTSGDLILNDYHHC